MKAIRAKLILILVGSLGYTGVALAADVFNGKEVYMRECEACHGEDGTGNMPGMPNFKEGQTLNTTDNTLIEIIRDGRGVMPSFGGLLKDDDILDVTAYLRSFL